MTLADRVQQLVPQTRAELEALVAIPSVSADPGRAADVGRSADAVAELLRDAGFPSVEVVQEGGAPAVIASYPAPEGAPTVLLYAHHDVQPTGDVAAWTSEPFTATERGGRLYGRGAADDKAGVMAHVTAFRAHDAAPPVGVTVFVEGEEESGSPSLGAVLAAHGDRLAADVIVVADAVNWDVGVPSLTISLRGLADAVVTVRTAPEALHSGIWGGPVPDAHMALVKLLSSLHDDRGNVAVEGLHVAPATDFDYPESRLRADSGIPDTLELVGDGSIGDRLANRPALTVIGIDATPVDEAANALPPVARAKLSLRVAPGGDAREHLEALRRHVEAHVPWGAEVTFEAGETGEPFAVDLTRPAVHAAHAAFAEAWEGGEMVDFGMGGSIPFIADFVERFPQAAVLITGVEDPASRAHGIDESLHLAEFERVCLAEALLLERLAQR